MNKLVFLIIIGLVLLTSCKTTQKGYRETEAKILFKNLLKDSEKISDVKVSGLFRISGVKEIPAGFVNFECFGNVKNQTLSFKVSFLKKPIFEISAKDKEILFINHTAKQFIKLKMENVDFSKFIGINFSPIELSYIFLGKCPYSSDIEMMNSKFNGKEYVLEITNSVSKYTVFVNRTEDISKVIIDNQYFDAIIMDSIQYTKNAKGEKVPKNVSFTTLDGKIKMSFIIEKISFDKQTEEKDYGFLSEYAEVFDINDIKVKLK
ncbi:MAG: hypothetical protein A2086_01885 [Spirochaetes bacterium GWD1_27_9]|nr:MAG: hypothetical protein A2Z98_07985 [Spirochaetes bacterium GWB1_27_13]OHD23992.1 MAG: hypothetical protein A2Y34_10480 [Spirochaetes bacterium GWC1_27_15]OHD41612.1 MAG: hypothetical protein A2086_01885 [Spirochaetes bacterium GWD1_27_9]